MNPPALSLRRPDLGLFALLLWIGASTTARAAYRSWLAQLQRNIAGNMVFGDAERLFKR